MRHADVVYFDDPGRRVAHTDVVLTPAGLQQAHSTGAALAEVRLDRVVTSGLARTEQTAEIVLDHLRHPPADPEPWRLPELEEILPGDPSAIPDDELAEAFLAPFRRGAPLDRRFLGGESLADLVQRVGRATRRIYADDRWRTLLVIAHGAVNRAILSEVLVGSGAFLGTLEQSPACLNVIDGDPGAQEVRAVNITPYDLLQPDTLATSLEQFLAQYVAFRAGNSEP